jgi:hypothetical protein
MLHPELRQQLGRDNVAALAKAAETASATTQAATRTPHVYRTGGHNPMRGGAMRRTRIMLLLGSTGAAVLVGMFVHR